MLFLAFSLIPHELPRPAFVVQIPDRDESAFLQIPLLEFIPYLALELTSSKHPRGNTEVDSKQEIGYT